MTQGLFILKEEKRDNTQTMETHSAREVREKKKNGAISIVDGPESVRERRQRCVQTP